MRSPLVVRNWLLVVVVFLLVNACGSKSQETSPGAEPDKSPPTEEKTSAPAKSESVTLEDVISSATEVATADIGDSPLVTLAKSAREHAMTCEDYSLAAFSSDYKLLLQGMKQGTLDSNEETILQRWLACRVLAGPVQFYSSENVGYFTGRVAQLYKRFNPKKFEKLVVRIDVHQKVGELPVSTSLNIKDALDYLKKNWTENFSEDGFDNSDFKPYLEAFYASESLVRMGDIPANFLAFQDSWLARRQGMVSIGTILLSLMQYRSALERAYLLSESVESIPVPPKAWAVLNHQMKRGLYQGYPLLKVVAVEILTLLEVSKH